MRRLRQIHQPATRALNELSNIARLYFVPCLRRPAADYLRDGIYELRAKAGRVQYRMLYFFQGRQAVVISHGITKQEATVPATEIERARRRKQAFEADPPRHTYKETT